MAVANKALPEGVQIRHGRRCGSRDGGRCSCLPTFQARVPLGERGSVRTKSFGSADEAKLWRSRELLKAFQSKRAAARPMTLREAAEELLAGMRDGSIVNRSGDTYKPSVTRGYEQGLRIHLLPDLGARRLDDLTTGDFQRLVERIRKDGFDASTVRNAMLPARVVYRRAIQLERVAFNPTVGLALPAVRGRRDRIAPPVEAAQLIAATPTGDRVIWATAFYGGLRFGELRALRWEDVDLAGGMIHVRRSWDEKEGVVGPKSIAGTRRVPIPALLRAEIGLARERRAWTDGLAFGRTYGTPFGSTGVYKRARKAWKAERLDPITMHEARHTYASLMIAAGVAPKELQEYMGHSSITVTLDRYGHLFAGTHEQAALKLDAYLARSSG